MPKTKTKNQPTPETPNQTPTALESQETVVTIPNQWLWVECPARSDTPGAVVEFRLQVKDWFVITVTETVYPTPKRPRGGQKTSDSSGGGVWRVHCPAVGLLWDVLPVENDPDIAVSRKEALELAISIVMENLSSSRDYLAVIGAMLSALPSPIRHLAPASSKVSNIISP